MIGRSKSADTQRTSASAAQWVERTPGGGSKSQRSALTTGGGKIRSISLSTERASAATNQPKRESGSTEAALVLESKQIEILYPIFRNEISILL